MALYWYGGMLVWHLIVGRAIGEARDASPAVRVLGAVDNLVLAVVHHTLYGFRARVFPDACHARDR